jgi:hypothetical protein
VGARLGLRRRGEDRLGQAIALPQAGWQRDAADGAVGAVLLPAGARQVAADHDLDRQHVRPAAEHHPAAQLRPAERTRPAIGRRPEPAVGQVVRVGREQVVGNDAGRLDEPEAREAGQDAALVRDRRREHDVEGGQPVAGDEQEAVLPDREQVADLARADEGVSERHRRGPPARRGGR